MKTLLLAWSLILALIVASCPALAEQGTSSYGLCSSGPLATMVLRTLAGTSNYREAAQNLQGKLFRVSSQQGRVELRKVDGRSAASLRSPEIRPNGCFAPEADLRVQLDQDDSLVLGDALAAEMAVLDYRTSFVWPIGGSADIAAPSSLILARIERPYVFVVIAGTESGCAQLEYYRVESNLVVRPFDGCVHGHKPSPALPGYLQLPP